MDYVKDRGIDYAIQYETGTGRYCYDCRVGYYGYTNGSFCTQERQVSLLGKVHWVCYTEVMIKDMDKDMMAIISMNAKPIKVQVNKEVFKEGFMEQDLKKEEKMMPRAMEEPVKEIVRIDMDKVVIILHKRGLILARWKIEVLGYTRSIGGTGYGVVLYYSITSRVLWGLS